MPPRTPEHGAVRRLENSEDLARREKFARQSRWNGESGRAWGSTGPADTAEVVQGRRGPTRADVGDHLRVEEIVSCVVRHDAASEAAAAAASRHEFTRSNAIGNYNSPRRRECRDDCGAERCS